MASVCDLRSTTSPRAGVAGVVYLPKTPMECGVLSDLVPPNCTMAPFKFGIPLRGGGSGVSSLSARGEDWFSGPEEKSASNVLRGVVNEGLRNCGSGLITGVVGKA